jgi:dimeric dUTPase (all-alpha-NTP-PPase superfamily)
MDFQALFPIQAALDEHIHQAMNVTYESTFSKRLLALLTEIGECANETRCFKYWSKKAPSGHEVIREEYVDILHFILSFGVAFHFETVAPADCGEDWPEDVSGGFVQLIAIASAFGQTPFRSIYARLLGGYVRLANQLGFSSDELVTAYNDKNAVNYARQASGY